MVTTPLEDSEKIPRWQYLPDPLIHFSLETLFPAACPGTWLVIDIAQSIVTLLSSPCPSSQPARVWCHQSFTPSALRALISLLRFPDTCPYTYLLVALQAPESLLVDLLTLSSDPLTSTFYQTAEDYDSLLQDTTGQRREQHLRHLRRVMTDVMAGTKHLGLTVISMRNVGYRLQPTIHPEGYGRSKLYRLSSANQESII